jgi:hypothetical protein
MINIFLKPIAKWNPLKFIIIVGKVKENVPKVKSHKHSANLTCRNNANLKLGMIDFRCMT